MLAQVLAPLLEVNESYYRPRHDLVPSHSGKERQWKFYVHIKWPLVFRVHGCHKTVSTARYYAYLEACDKMNVSALFFVRKYRLYHIV